MQNFALSAGDPSKNFPDNIKNKTIPFVMLFTPSLSILKYYEHFVLVQLNFAS